MEIRIISKIGLFAIGAALLPMLSAGCNNKPKQTVKHEPPKVQEPARAVDSILEVQAINAAHTDPSLSNAHFDGADLNSLGRSKMVLIMRGTSPGKPTVVYLDLNRSELTQQRRGAVEKYWRDMMTTQAHLELRDGAAEVAGSARQGLNRLPLTNSNPKNSNADAGVAVPGMTEPHNEGNSGTSGPQDTLFK